MWPLFPSAAEPLLNTRRPLVPDAPLFAVSTEMCPLLVAVPSPLSTEMQPPDAPVLRPAAAARLPPAPLVPLPT